MTVDPSAVGDSNQPATKDQPQETIIVDCPRCHLGLDVPVGSPSYKCEYCGQEIHLNYLDDESSPSDKPPCDQDYEWQVESRHPLLDCWKTSWPLWFLGVIVNFVLGESAGVITGLMWVYVVWFALSLFYACVFYPSFFTEKPRLKSRHLVSFLNGAFGYLVFGAIFNNNLTKRKRGISYIVFAIMEGLLLVLNLAALTILLNGYPSTADNIASYSDKQETLVSSIAASPDALVNEDGFTATFPTEPEVRSGTSTVSEHYEVLQTAYYSELDDGEYLIIVTRYPEDLVSMYTDNPEAIKGGLSGMILSFARDLDAPSDVVEIQYDELQGFPSAYTTFEYDGFLTQARAVFANNCAYLCAAGATGEEAAQAGVQFMNSFSLTD